MNWNLFEIEIFCNNVNVFIVFNACLLTKNIDFLKKKNAEW